MKIIRNILLVAGLLYALITIILMFNEEMLDSMNMFDVLNYFKYWLVLAIVIILGLIITGTLYIRSLRKQYRQLEQEHASVKAHVYDIEQARKAEDLEAGRRIEAFRHSLDKGNTPGNDAAAIDPDQPQA